MLVPTYARQTCHLRTQAPAKQAGVKCWLRSDGFCVSYICVSRVVDALQHSHCCNAGTSIDTNDWDAESRSETKADEISSMNDINVKWTSTTERGWCIPAHHLTSNTSSQHLFDLEQLATEKRINSVARVLMKQMRKCKNFL